jgi:arginase
MPSDYIPVFLGGDHSLSLGSLPGLAERAAKLGRPFFVLWIDAHPDCHTLDTTESGHLHGTPVAQALGAPSFTPSFAAVGHALPAANLMMVGVRSVDAAEASLIESHGITVHAPADVRDRGPEAVLGSFLAGIRSVGGLLHVSLDADALDPAVAPGVGTPVAEGLTVGEVRRMLAAVSTAGVLGSMDLVEVNPFLDRDQRTARTMVQLAVAALRPAGSAGDRIGSVG